MGAETGACVNEYVISCCSTADLTLKHFEERNISYICFHYFLNEKEYEDDFGKTMPLSDFYNAMKEGAMTKTSQVNADEFEQYFDQILSQGKDLIHFSLSSGISGVVNSALIAMEEMKKKYPDRKIYVVDSMAASSGYGLLMDRIADLRDQGMGIDELYQWSEEHKLELNHWFFTSDLTYLVRGGRVSRTSGFIGGVLNICPLLNVDFMGRLIARDKIRTKKKVIKAIVQRMVENAADGINYSDKCYISNSACYEDAQEVVDLIEETFPNMKGKVEINDIGTTIGSHTGPGTVALFFWGKKRVD